jgi:NTE family protein
MKWLDTLLKRNQKIGIALSGGATLGAAHIGVLQVLEREGIRPDFVAGTSAGALVGAIYCAGVPLNEMEQIFVNLKWPNLLKFVITNPISVFDMQPMDGVIKKIIGDCDFKDLNIPFAAIGCDLMTGERVVLDHGPVAPAIRASASVPGIFSPVEIDGRLLVDGGVVDNLPVKQLNIMGANFTIASDVSNRGETSKRPEHMFDVLQTMFNIMQDRGALVSSDQCDCYIRPAVTQFSCWGFDESDQILAEGRIAAERAVVQLKKKLRR